MWNFGWGSGQGRAESLFIFLPKLYFLFSLTPSCESVIICL